MIFLDFETFYDRDFSLSKISTEEYIRDPRFEVIGVAVKVDDEETQSFSGSRAETKAWLQQFDWGNSLACAHNALFDAAILAWHFEIYPKAWADTMSMAQALLGTRCRVGLSHLATWFKIGTKGDEVINALGKTRKSFTHMEMERYMSYCRNDVDLTAGLYTRMYTFRANEDFTVEEFPVKEMKLIDLTIRMFTEPTLEVDVSLLEDHLIKVRENKAKLLHDASIDLNDVMSNLRFAQILCKLGIVPPTKLSPTTGKVTYAFAKTDEGFQALLEHPDLRVQTVVSARLGVKTTIEESRTERFIGIGKRGPLPVPLKYYAAHTGRWGGSDKLNMQNLPSRGNASALKKSLRAPDGHVIISCDSSQIEARTLAWLAGQNDLVNAFAKGEDVYKIMASKIYQKPVTEITKEQRFFGKTVILGCFGADTEVLTRRGWVRIVDVLDMDLLWDGEEWVSHRGLVPQGEKETINSYGVNATPDHAILTGHGWREWSEVCTNPLLFQSAIRKGGSLFWSGLDISDRTDALTAGTPSCVAPAGGKGLWTGTTLQKVDLLGAINALRLRAARLGKTIGGTKLLFPTKKFGLGYSTGFQVVSNAAISPLAKHIHTTGAEVLRYMHRGVQIGRSFLNTLSLLTGMGTLTLTSTGLTTAWGMSRGICGSLPAKPTSKTDVPLLSYKRRSTLLKKRMQTYDIAYAGPRNRYTIRTSQGPILVHNCGYGMGAEKFHGMLSLKQETKISMDEAERIIQVYRGVNNNIVRFWKLADRAIHYMATSTGWRIGRNDLLEIGDKCIVLPNTMKIEYDNLRVDASEGWFYSTLREKNVKLYGGKLVENVVQALARIIVGEQMLKIAKKYRPVLTVHDAVSIIVPEQESTEAMAYVQECMRWVPKWANGLPVDCEIGCGPTYADS